MAAYKDPISSSAVVSSTTAAGIRAFKSAKYREGQLAVLALAQPVVLRWVSASTTADDGLSCIKPTDIGGGAGRFLAMPANGGVAGCVVKVQTDVNGGTVDYTDSTTDIVLPVQTFKFVGGTAQSTLIVDCVISSGIHTSNAALGTTEGPLFKLQDDPAHTNLRTVFNTGKYATADALNYCTYIRYINTYGLPAADVKFRILGGSNDGLNTFRSLAGDIAFTITEISG